jgi:hypothetical protein
MLGARAGLTPRANLAPVTDIPAEGVQVFVVDVVDPLGAKITVLASGITPASPAASIVTHNLSPWFKL